MGKYKELYIVRHGKSSWDYEDVSDIDRPLKERGINDGYIMAKRLLNNNRIPNRILTSPANRASHTAIIFSRVFDIKSDNIIINKDVYLAGVDTILEVVRKTGDDINSLMIFGHNPTVTDLANLFLDNNIDNIPTTGIVGLKFKLETWSKIERNKPLESFFDYPKNIH